MTSDQYIEKAFFYLLLLSIVLHAAGFVTLYFWPKEQQQQLSEPTFIDLQDMPTPKAQAPSKPPEVVRPSDKRRRVVKETAPRSVAPRQAAPQPDRKQTASSAGRPGQATAPSQPASPGGSSASELLRRKPQPQQQGGGGGTKPQPDLMPSASRMAQLEESYRRRFADEIAKGDTHFLNTDDIQLGSFLSRFERQVYGIWRYPLEAMQRGDEGVVAIKITFNRSGAITDYKVLNSSGKQLLDNEVFRLLRIIQTGGSLGGLPKSYPKDEFSLIAFFQYGGARSRLR